MAKTPLITPNGISQVTTVFDFACPIGTPVRAAHDGVAWTSTPDNGPYGIYLDLLWAPPDEFMLDYTRYAHLSQMLVADGDSLRAGDVVGLSGNTGNSTGPHLHLGLRASTWAADDPWRGWRDPEPHFVEDARALRIEEERMHNLLTPHFENPTPWAASVVTELAPRYVKQYFHGPDEEDLFPRQRTIARVDIGGDGVERGYYERGAIGAQEYFERCLPFYRGLRHKVYCFEAVNEPAVNTRAERLAYAAFFAEWAQLMHGINWRIMGGSFANGTPEVLDPRALAELGAIWSDSDFWGLHEYGRPTLESDAEWYSLRHRRLGRELIKLGYSLRPTIISEAGLDGTGTEFGQVGWRDPRFCSGDFERYLMQLDWYNREVYEHDVWIVAICLFNSGTLPGSRWGSFELGEVEWRRWIQHVRG